MSNGAAPFYYYDEHIPERKLPYFHYGDYHSFIIEDFREGLLTREEFNLNKIQNKEEGENLIPFSFFSSNESALQIKQSNFSTKLSN